MRKHYPLREEILLRDKQAYSYAAAADAGQMSSLASAQAAYTTAMAQSDADHQNWLASAPVGGQPVGPDPLPGEQANATLALSNATADANLGWIKAKDAADQSFAVTDAGNWQTMINGEATASYNFTVADDAATAKELNAEATATAKHMSSDATADATHGNTDEAATGNYQESEASATATEMQGLANALGNTPWATYEAQLAQALAGWESTAVSDEENYVSQIGSNEETYAGKDGSAYETEVSTLVSDDLSGTNSASDAIASADQTLATKLAGDEQAFETADATATQTYQDAVAGDANVYQKAVNQAAHDLAVGAIDSAGYTSAVAAAAATQATNDATALAKFRTAEGTASSTQVQNDADAVQADANAVATAVHTAATADATAVHAYTLSESSAYYNEATGDADDLATLEREEADGYEAAIAAFEQAHPSPWSQELLAQAQAEQSRVDGVPGTTRSSYTGTAGAEDNLAHAQATATENQETAEANAQETRDVSAADNAFTLATATATADYTQQGTLATSDTNLSQAGLAPLADGDGRAAPPPAAGGSSGSGGGGATSGGSGPGIGGGGVTGGDLGQDGPLPPTPPGARPAPTVTGNYGPPAINGYTLPGALGTFQGLVSGLFTAAPLVLAAMPADTAEGDTPKEAGNELESSTARRTPQDGARGAFDVPEHFLSLRGEQQFYGVEPQNPQRIQPAGSKEIDAYRLGAMGAALRDELAAVQADIEAAESHVARVGLGFVLGGGAAAAERHIEELKEKARAIEGRLDLLRQLYTAVGLDNVLIGGSSVIGEGEIIREEGAGFDAAVGIVNLLRHGGGGGLESSGDEFLVADAALIVRGLVKAGGESLLRRSATVLDEAAEAAGAGASNRATFEAYKAALRRKMGKPYVKNAELAEFVDDIYRENATLGSGSTADAIRVELAFPGTTVGGREHVQKGRDAITHLLKWLRRNPDAPKGDIAAAQNIILDILDALGTQPLVK